MTCKAISIREDVSGLSQDGHVEEAGGFPRRRQGRKKEERD